GIYLVMVLFTAYSLVNNIFLWRNRGYNIEFEGTVVTESRLEGLAYHTVEQSDDASWVVLFHSWGRNSSRMALQCQIYIDRGYNLLLVDAPGHGRSKWVPVVTGMRYAEVTSRICEKHNIKPVIAHGLSFGSITSLLFMEGRSLHALVLEALPNNFRDLYEGFFRVLPMPRFLLFWIPILFLSLKDITPYEPNTTLERVNCPVFLLHGQKDKMLPLQNHHPLSLKKLEGKQVTEWIVPDAPHSRLAEHPEYATRLNEFLNSL
ncbi:MAG: alpha/beta fold hydrolase, partial [Candidatus Kariarchaeaceae archaeon]